MTLRSDLIPVVDDTRSLIADLGLRLYTVQTVLRTWSGTQRGLGEASDVTVAIEPTPRVSDPPPRRTPESGGRTETGDRQVTRISATYEMDDLTGGTLGALQEFFWLIDGAPYRVVGVPEKKPFEWRVQLARMSRSPR